MNIYQSHHRLHRMGSLDTDRLLTNQCKKVFERL